MNRRYLSVKFIILVVFLVNEPSECQNTNNKIDLVRPTSAGSSNKVDCKNVKCEPNVRKCALHQELTQPEGECCPRCVCVEKCPPLDWSICGDGFRAIVQPKKGNVQCCDTIVCISRTNNNDDLIINIKEVDKGKVTNGAGTFTSAGTNGYSLNHLDDLEEDVDDGVLVDGDDDEDLDLDNNEVDLSENYFSLENFPNYDQQITQLNRQKASSSSSSGETTKNHQNFIPDEKDYYLEDKEDNGNMTSHSVCSMINCSQEKFKYYRENLNCPEDSVLNATDDIEEHCCQLSSKCSCAQCDPKPSKGWCKMAGNNFEPILVRKGENVPGKCCDIYICHSANFTCNLNGEFFSHNSEWKLNPCTSCRCDMGFITCKKTECPELDCEIKQSLISECCPVCTGECRAQSGTVYKSNDVWNEDDDCTECKCVNGRKECTSEFCQYPPCANPIKIPGQCCKVCPKHPLINTPQSKESLSQFNFKYSNFPPHCKSKIDKLDCARLDCKHYGVKLDGNRCPTCSCADKPMDVCPFACDQDDLQFMPLNDRLCKCAKKKCPILATKCNLTCLNGFQKGLDGCDLCKCRDENANLDDIQSSKINECVDQKTGHIWFDGCRQCTCVKGEEYCSLISCNKNSIDCSTASNPSSNNMPNSCCPNNCGSNNQTFSLLKQQTINTTVCKFIKTSNKNDQLTYEENQIWSMDKCTKCICKNGFVLCNVLSHKCPPLTCSNPIVDKNGSSCCPVCPTLEVNDLLSVNKSLPSVRNKKISPQWSCVDSQGNYRQHGAKWKETTCRHCSCANGEMTCYSHEAYCPAITGKNTCTSLEVYRKHECCPICLDTFNAPFSVFTQQFDSSFFLSKKNSTNNNKWLILFLCLVLTLIVLILIFIALMRSLKKNRQPSKSSKEKFSNLTLNKSIINPNDPDAKSSVPHHMHRPTSEYLYNEKPLLQHQHQHNHHHHHPHPHHTLSKNHYNDAYKCESGAQYHTQESSFLANNANNIEFISRQPLLGPKYNINSTSNQNLNVNNSGSEISDSSHNEDNSKSTLLTGLSSEFNNSNSNSTRLNFSMPVNSQICYF